MSMVWNDGPPPEEVDISPLGWLRVAVRGVMIFVINAVGLSLMLLLRLIEKPLFKLQRPVTPWISLVVCSATLWTMGLDLKTSGKLLRQRKGAVVANHSSWLDICVLNARRRVYFVSKAEVASWPGISWLAKASGTLFIERDRRKAGTQVAVIRDRLVAGHKLLFFPEGTSTDGRRVIGFKPTLFAAFFDEALQEEIHVQPVTVIYRAPEGRDPRFYGWWGSQDLGPHLLKVLAESRRGEVEVIYHEPVHVSEFENRKSLAAYCERIVRDPMELELAQAAE